MKKVRLQSTSGDGLWEQIDNLAPALRWKVRLLAYLLLASGAVLVVGLALMFGGVI